MSRPGGRGGRAKPECTCVWLTHPRTGARVSIIRWCSKHKPPMYSLKGNVVGEKR